MPIILKDKLYYIFKILFLFICFFLVQRIIFLILFYQSSSFLSIMFAFLQGLRFDLSTIFIFTILPITFTLLPINKSYYYKVIHWVLYVIFVVFIFSIVSDFFYYAITLKRIGFEVLLLIPNLVTLLKMTFLTPIMFSPICITILSILLFKSWKRFSYDHKRLIQPRLSLHNIGVTLLSMLLLITCGAIIIRGGLQKRPLKPIVAFQNESHFIGYLALNSIYLSVTALYKKDKLPILEPSFNKDKYALQLKVYSKNESSLNSDYPFFREIKFSKKMKKKHIMILILESWGSKNSLKDTTRNSTPFFSRLKKQSFSFNYYFSTASRTIPVLPAVISSIPSLYGNIYTTSSYQYNQHRGLGSIFKEKGYQTLFIHSAEKGSMGFSSYVPLAGFNTIITKENFQLQGKEYEDGVWGIYDKYSLNKLHSIMLKAKQPVLSVFFSLHPHLPFSAPPSYVKNNHSYQENYLASRSYMDVVLENFFKKARTSSYFKDTLFVILGDHGYETKMGLHPYKTPLLFYSPNFIVPGESNQIASSLDILPTLLDLLHVSTTHTSMGKALSLSTAQIDKNKNWALIDFDQTIGIIDNHFTYILSQSDIIKKYHFPQDMILKKEVSLTAKDKSTKWEMFISYISNTIMKDKIMDKHY